MKINQLIVGRRYYYQRNQHLFIEVLHRNDAQNIIVYEQFSLSFTGVKNDVVRSLTSVTPTNGAIHTQEFYPVVPKTSRVTCHLFDEESATIFITALKTDEEADHWIAEHPQYKLLKREVVQYDDPNYVEPKAEDEDEVNEV